MLAGNFDMKQIAVLYHSFYQLPHGSPEKIFNPLAAKSTVLVNSPNHNGKLHFEYSYQIQTTNKGKDIGGKLALIDLSLNMGLRVNYYILLHDKKSIHNPLGEIWRKKLFRIIEPEQIETIIRIFETDKKVGIVAAQEFIMNEYDRDTDNFSCTSHAILKELIAKYNLKLNTYDFVGGTMFWIRAEIIERFFRKHSPLEIRATLEQGNVLDTDKGTYTHAWERMFSWIATDQQYTIKGI